METKQVVRIALLSSLGTLLIFAVIGGGGYVAYTKFAAGWIVQYQIDHESKSIIAEVSKVVVLPSDDAPKVTKILDANQLKQGDQFFADAKNGDAVLFFEKSGLLILFDLGADKLLNMGSTGTTTDTSAYSQ